MKPIKYISILLLIILSSCKKEVNEKLTATEPQIVVNAFISPSNDSIRVQLDYSKSYFNESNNRDELVKNISLANVIINDGISDKKLIWSRINRHFHISKNELPILANRKYTLRINTVDGKVASAETTIPSPITDFDLIITATYNKKDNRYNKIKMNLKDEKGVENYYRFALYSQIKYINPNFPINEQFVKIDIKFFTDNKDQLENIFLLSEASLQESSNNGSQTKIETYLRGYFEKGDEAYYKYLTTVEQNSDSGGNPFVEPVSVFTNIKGGLGVFSSYQRVEKTIRSN